MFNILVCDDDKEIVDAIDIYLSQEGYRILKAYDGLQAIQMMKQEEIHLLLMDVMMPNWMGFAPREKYGNTAVSLLSYCLLSQKMWIRFWD